MLFSILIPLAAAAAAVKDETAQIAAVSWGEDRVDVFGAVGADVWHKYYTQEGGWEPHGKFENLGSAKESLYGTPAVVSWAEGRLDFFAVDDDSTPYHKYWDGSNWGPTGLETLGGDNDTSIYSDLAAVAWGPDRLDVVGKGEGGSYLHLYWDGSQWNGWEDLGLPAKGLAFESSPTITSWGKNRFDIFGIAENGSAYHKFWAGDHYEPTKGWEWLAWQEPDGGFKQTTLTSSSWGEKRLDFWTVGANGNLYHTLWDHDFYLPWESLGGNFKFAPKVAHWAPGRIDIVGQDADSAEYQYKFWDGYGWRPSASGWYSKGEFSSQPAVAASGANKLNILGVNDAGQLVWQAWNQTYWVPSADEFIELGDVTVPFGDGDDEEVRKSAKQIFFSKPKVDI